MGVFRNGERIVSYYDRKYDFKSERKSDKSERNCSHHLLCVWGPGQRQGKASF